MISVDLLLNPFTDSNMDVNLMVEVNYSLFPILHLKLWLVAHIARHFFSQEKQKLMGIIQQSTENIPQVQVWNENSFR